MLNFLDRLFADIQYSLRSLLKTPLITIAVAISLALGIGATAAVFSLIDSFLLRPLSVPHADQVVRIVTSTETARSGNLFSGVQEPE